MLKKFKNQFIILIALLLLLPVLIIGAMLYMANHTKPVVLEEQREAISSALEELAQGVPTNISYLMARKDISQKPRTEQIKTLNRELAGAVMRVFERHPGVELGYYSPDVKAVLVQMGQDSYLPYMDFNNLFLDVSEDTQWSQQAQWKDAFDKVIWSKEPLELVIGSPGNQKLIMLRPLLVDQQVEAVVWAGERLGGINKEILKAESFAYTVIFFGFLLGLCSTFFLLKNYMDAVANIKTGLHKMQTDLTYVIPSSLGELGEISKAINDLASRLVSAQNYNEIILASIDAGIVAVDLRGNIVSVNSSARKIFQLPQDVVDRHLKEVFPEDSPIVNLLLQGLAGEEIKDYLIKGFGPQDLQLTANTAKLYDAKQQVVGAVLSCRDVTQRMRLQEQMRRQERLASLGQLVAGVAHEIKNPLTSISGYIQFWLKSKTPTTKSLNTIYREVRRLDSIVNKLLFFTKPTHMVLATVEVNDFLHRVLSFFLETHAENIQFEMLEGQDLPQIQIDPDQVEQVLMNVIYNAVQSMPKGGTVTIKTGYVTEEKRVFIAVQDTGVGVPKELLDKLFDPFFSTRSKGTGLGLTIAHEIIRAHGGRIEISSQEKVGTCVRIDLPVVTA